MFLISFFPYVLLHKFPLPFRIYNFLRSFCPSSLMFFLISFFLSKHISFSIPDVLLFCFILPSYPFFILSFYIKLLFHSLCMFHVFLLLFFPYVLIHLILSFYTYALFPSLNMSLYFSLLLSFLTYLFISLFLSKNMSSSFPYLCLHCCSFCPFLVYFFISCFLYIITFPFLARVFICVPSILLSLCTS